MLEVKFLACRLQTNAYDDRSTISMAFLRNQ